MEKFFNIDNIEEVKQKIKENLSYPYVYIYHSTLGGKENISILLTISLDNPNTWYNQILENSAYIKLHILNYGVIELISKNRNVKKFRKTRFKSIDNLIKKLNDKIRREGENG